MCFQHHDVIYFGTTFDSNADCDSLLHICLVVQFNVNAPKEQRDLGGLMLLIVFNLLRRKFWQTGPLLEQLVPAHPVFTLDFLRPAKMNGSWDRWVAVTLNYHKEVAGMLRALDGPLFSMAGLQPPHVIVACLLEPVHVKYHVQSVCHPIFALSYIVYACTSALLHNQHCASVCTF